VDRDDARRGDRLRARTRRPLAFAIAQAELFHLHLQALAADLQEARGLRDVAAGLVERLDDQLARGAGGATDWELLQIQQNSGWWGRITFWSDGQVVANPFE
jgi:hypothetical protein